MLTRRWLIGLATIFLAGAEPEGPLWLTDYSRALEVARAANKPLFVVFRCEH